MRQKASRTLSKIYDISRIFVGVDDDFDVPNWLVSLMTLWIVCKYPEGFMFKIWMINNISRILAGVDDDFDISDWGWCP